MIQKHRFRREASKSHPHLSHKWTRKKEKLRTWTSYCQTCNLGNLLCSVFVWISQSFNPRTRKTGNCQTSKCPLLQGILATWTWSPSTRICHCIAITFKWQKKMKKWTQSHSWPQGYYPLPSQSYSSHSKKPKITQDQPQTPQPQPSPTTALLEKWHQPTWSMHWEIP